MADIARPALASVLAALTQYDPDRWPDDSFSRVVAAFAGAGWTEKTIDASGWGAGPLSAHWTTTNPAEAAELLATRDVLPAGWCDVERRGWRWTSFVAAARSDCEVTSPTPRTIPDLVAVASLEWPAIQRAEELARAACHALREYGCPTPERVVWRVGSRSPSDAVLWRARGLVVVSVRGVVLVGGRLDVRPDRRVVVAAEALWTSGLALDRITADAVVVVVPPVGGAS